MKHVWHAFIGILLFAGCASAIAQTIYTCKDASGRTLTSDRPIPECAKLPMREIGRSGIVVREIAAPLTPEQIAERDAAIKRKHEEEEVEKEQHRQDTAILATYSSEQSIQAARTRALSEPGDALRNALQQKHDFETIQEQNNKDLAALKGKPVPPALQRRVDETSAALAGENLTIANRHEEIDHINDKFDNILLRFRVITGAQSKP